MLPFKVTASFLRMFSKCWGELQLSADFGTSCTVSYFDCCCFELDVRSIAILTWATCLACSLTIAIGKGLSLFQHREECIFPHICGWFLSHIQMLFIGFQAQLGLWSVSPTRDIIFPILQGWKKIGNFFFFFLFFLPILAKLDEIKLLWKHRFGPNFLLWCFLLLTTNITTLRILSLLSKSHTWAEEIDWDHTMQPIFVEEIDLMPLWCKHHPECDILACFWPCVDGWSCSYIYQNWFSDFLRTGVMRSKNHHPDNPARGFMLSWIPAQHLYSLFT